MNFGDAIAALKQGKKVSRSGWNGKGMYIYLNDGGGFLPPNGPVVTATGVRCCEPVICMLTAQLKHQPGWLASQADMLAEDWDLVP